MSMQLCTACQKSLATIHVTEVLSGNLVEQKHLCAPCAESTGLLQSKPLKLSPEVLDDLISGLKPVASGAKSRRGREGPICAGCGMTAAEFKLRGRMGCPRCYTVFRTALLPLLDRVHDGSSHRGRFPSTGMSAIVQPDLVADLKRRLAVAIAAQDYKVAAGLRDQLRQLEGQVEGRPE